ncbi:MAG: SusC/RagA family TonB-linked outer membrane protein [Bacteroidetes bacterium]|nr:SusC/RagA family TonB-linked outer membrane protein [Bacteroidota bacterium]
MLLAIMRKAAMLLLAVIGFAAFAKAQTVTGTVTDSKGDPVSGISVTVKGTTKGTSTNAQGVYTLNGVAVGSTLLFSGTGYTGQSVKVTGAGPYNVTLQANVINQNEVVVIGYQTVRKKDLTGAVGSVSSKNFNTGAINTPDQLLQSKVAGVLVTTNSGEPGAGTSIQVRGTSSLRSNNNPLYVIDGVPLDGRNAEPGFSASSLGGTPTSNPLLFLNPNDIENLEILKDAASAAIYGSRGANGVIVITTKKAKPGAMKLDAAADFGAFAGYMKKFEILSKSDFVTALSKYGAASTWNGGQSVDPLKEITSKSVSSAYNIALGGGNENGRYRASFYANNTEGFLKGTGLEKYIANFNGSTTLLDKKLTLDFYLNAGSVPHRFGAVTNTAGSQGNLMSAALQWNPTYSFYNPDGSYFFPTNGTGNPLAFIAAINDRAVTNSVLGNISGTYKIIKGLEYKLLFSINNSTGQRKTNYPGWLQGYTGISGLGLGAIANAKLNSQLISHTLSYNGDLTKKLRITGLLGYEYWKSQYSFEQYVASGFNTNLTQSTIIPILYTSMMQDGNVQSLPTTYVDPLVEVQSYFARAILNYDNRYILTALVRRDGSSKFGSNNKYGTFPSFAGRWTISNEDFMKDNNIFSTLALRASWGITGNQEYPAGSGQEQFAFGSYNSAGQVNVYNPNLKWEQTKSTNIGLEFAVMKGRINGTFDWYKKNTTNLLYQSQAIQPAPATSTWINIPADLINQGFEVQLNGNLVDKKEFSWDLSLNYSYNKNKLTKFNLAPIQTGTINGQGLSGALSEVIANGYPLQEFYLKHFTGFDANGNQQVTAAPDYAGDPNPHSYYGISTTLRYKKFDFVINGGGAGGFMIYNNTANGVTNIAGILQGRNIDKAAYNSAEKASSGIAASDRFLEKGNYFKLRNLKLGYNLGDVAKYVKGASVSISMNNVFVLTKFTGFDPEVNVDKSTSGYPSRSIEYVPYPTSRMIVLGLKFSL